MAETYPTVQDELVAGDVLQELRNARAKHGPMASAHEGYAVLLEEVDELWDEVKFGKEDRIARMRAEALQVAAMAIRFIEDVCDKEEASRG